MLLLYLSNLHSLTWNMFQVSGNSPTYAKCICTPPQSAYKMEKACCSFKHSCSVSLCMVSHRSSRYHCGNWVTSGTIRYINITGGHSYKKRGAAFGATLATFHHAQYIFSTKDIHPCNKPRQKKNQKCATNRISKTLSKKQREEQNGGLGLRWRIHTKLWTQKEGETNSVSTSIELLLPPP